MNRRQVSPYSFNHEFSSVPELAQPSELLLSYAFGPGEQLGNGLHTSDALPLAHNGPYSSPWSGGEPMVRQPYLASSHQLSSRTQRAWPPSGPWNSYGLPEYITSYPTTELSKQFSSPYPHEDLESGLEEITSTFPNQGNHQADFQESYWDARCQSQQGETDIWNLNPDYQARLPYIQSPQNLTESSLTKLCPDASRYHPDDMDPTHRNAIFTRSSDPEGSIHQYPAVMAMGSEDALMPTPRRQNPFTISSRLPIEHEQSINYPGQSLALPYIAGSPAGSQSRPPRTLGKAAQGKRKRASTMDPTKVQSSITPPVKRYKRRYSAIEKEHIALKKKNGSVCEDCRRAHRKCECNTPSTTTTNSPLMLSNLDATDPWGYS